MQIVEKSCQLRKALVVVVSFLLTFTAVGAFAASDDDGPARAGAQRLGPGDQVVVRALHAAEISDRPIRIDESGYIRLPLAGRIRAGGRTVDELAADVKARLEPLIRDPQVSVDVVEIKSQPVSVLGAVKTPGVYQIQGPKRVLEVLSLAGGVDTDAGYSIRVSRRKSMGPIPLPQGSVRDSGDFLIGEISLSGLIEAKNPEQNIVIFPQDVITVPRAKLVYVIGEVRRAGGFILKANDSMTVLQALSLAEGLTPFAKAGGAKVVRGGMLPGPKTELKVDIGKILSGKSPDVALLSDDVLVVPKSGAKSVLMRTVDASISLGTGVVIWR